MSALRVSPDRGEDEVQLHRIPARSLRDAHLNITNDLICRNPDNTRLESEFRWQKRLHNAATYYKEASSPLCDHAAGNIVCKNWLVI